MADAQFSVGQAGETLLEVRHRDARRSVFERVGEGSYLVRKDRFNERAEELIGREKRLKIGAAGTEVTIVETEFSWEVMTSDGFAVGSFFRSLARDRPGSPGRDIPSVHSLVRASDGRDYAAIGCHAAIRFEIGGLSSIRELPGGPLVVQETKSPVAQTPR